MKLDSSQTIALDEDSLRVALGDSDSACRELDALGRQEGLSRCEVDDVFGPLPDDLGISNCRWRAAEDSELSVSHFVAVAVGAVEDVSCPPLVKAGDVRKFVA
jgi:hypothetical protein